ncbi:MAG: ribonuclease III [Pseudomonadota bacterium]
MSERKDGKTSDRLSILEERIGYVFQDRSQLEQALTHSSLRKNPDDRFHYERLEFLGDRVLGLCIAELIFKRFADASEGELSLRLNALVKGKTLAEISDVLHLHEFIRTGGDLKLLTGKRMQSVRADVLEALIASIYLDGGLGAANAFIERFWQARINDKASARRDSKTALQEWAHSLGKNTPSYTEKDRTGPDHDPEFTVEVRVEALDGELGYGRSKRIAEQDAAKRMLIRENVWADVATGEGKA